MISYCLWSLGGGIALLNTLKLIFISNVRVHEPIREKISSESSSIADLECPAEYKPYFDRVPKNLVQKFLHPQHTSTDQKDFFELAKLIYTNNNLSSIFN